MLQNRKQKANYKSTESKQLFLKHAWNLDLDNNVLLFKESREVTLVQRTKEATLVQRPKVTDIARVISKIKWQWAAGGLMAYEADFEANVV